MTLKYTPEHQWLRVDDAAAGMATVGITIHAQGRYRLREVP